MTDETCEVLRVTSYGKGHFIVQARCNNNGEESNVLHRWRQLNSGRRLEIRDATIEASAADAWQEDFRRCRVLKQFSQGSVVISSGEKVVELDVQWNDGTDLDNLGTENISVKIDNELLPHPKPLKSDTGMLYGFGLGSFNAILPALSRGKRLQISISDKPERTVDLDIGAGGKAVAFLKKCDRHYWGRKHPPGVELAGRTATCRGTLTNTDKESGDTARIGSCTFTIDLYPGVAKAILDACRYARPCEVQARVNAGEIIQVYSAKRPR